MKPKTSHGLKDARYSLGARALIGLIRFYRRRISPLKPPTCRFYPTCSSYAIESVKRFGAARGGFLAVKRVLKCHPFNPGGYDPVPVVFSANMGKGLKTPAQREKGLNAAPLKAQCDLFQRHACQGEGLPRQATEPALSTPVPAQRSLALRARVLDFLIRGSGPTSRERAQKRGKR